MDWRQLIEKCAGGNVAAFNDFVKKYYGLLHYIISRKIPANGDHEDIIQEVLLKFHRLNLFEKFRGNSEGEFKAYLIRVCLNTLSSYVQRNSADNEKLVVIAPEDFEKLGMLVAQEGPLPALLENELIGELTEAVANLPLNYRDIINLRLLGHTNAEIAGILGSPKGTVDSYSARALEILKGKMKNYASK